MVDNAGVKQVWVKALIWHPTSVSRRISVTVLIDTGAGGGNYASEAFIKSIQKHLFNGESIVSTKGKGLLRAANPTDSQVPPMKIIGSAHLPLVFPPEDQVRMLTVRVVDSLPYGLIMGAAFLREKGSVINFGNHGGFKPTPSSPWVPFLTQGQQQPISQRKQAKGWKVQPCRRETPELSSMSEMDRAEQFCAVKPPVCEEAPQDLCHPQRVPL